MMIKRSVAIFMLTLVSFLSIGCEEYKQDALTQLRDYFPDAVLIPSNGEIWHFETNASGIGEATARSAFLSFRRKWNEKIYEKTAKWGAVASSLAPLAGPQLVIIGFREIEVRWVPGQTEATYFQRTP